MSTDEELKKLRKKLYKEGETFRGRLEGEKLSPIKKGAKTYWRDASVKKKDLRQKIESRRKRKKSSLLTFFVVLFVFLVIAGGLVYAWREIFLGGNIVSSRKINLVIEGPSIIKAGERNKWYVLITNNNKVSLELADLIIDYPEGTLNLGGLVLPRERRAVGKILPGSTKKTEIDIFVLGQEDQQKEMGLTLEYRLEDSNAIFAKEIKHVVKFSRSPIGISMKLPQEKESGQPVSMEVEYVSNSDIILKDVYLKMEYPPGFQFTESNFEPVRGNNLWSIGDLQPQEKRTLEIEGILEGQDLMEMNFRALVGPIKEGDDLIVFGSMTASVLLKKPFLNLAFLINGTDIDTVSGDKTLRISVPWKSNLTTEVRNANIGVKIYGEGINMRKLLISKGFYRSYDDTLIWNPASVPQLALISPGDEGSVAFSFEFDKMFPVEAPDDKNFTFRLEGEITGTRSGADGQTFTVTGTVSKEVKIASRVQIVPSVSFGSGPFVNSGPLPPRVGQETTYTLSWSVSNFYNDIGDVSVRTALPSHIRWLDTIDPSSENVLYDASTGEVVWLMDKVESGTGILKPAREVSFQIALMPPPNKEGFPLDLMLESTLECKDLFTDLILRDYKDSVTTRSIDEARLNWDFGVVAP